MAVEQRVGMLSGGVQRVYLRPHSSCAYSSALTATDNTLLTSIATIAMRFDVEDAHQCCVVAARTLPVMQAQRSHARLWQSGSWYVS